MILKYKTTRLSVSEGSLDIDQSELAKLLLRVPELLIPSVVRSLPPYFQGINSQSDAQFWFERIVSAGRLFIVRYDSLDLIIGFIFTATGNGDDVHIGYLLGEEYWGQGLASELLGGFIDQVVKDEGWVKLIGGVDINNQASSKLLVKLGFVEMPRNDKQMVFYEYQVP